MTRDGGSWARWRRGRIPRALIALVLGTAAAPLAARDVAVALPPATLDRALTGLARTSGVEIISTEPGLQRIATRGVRGRMSVRTALARLLAGTPYRAVALPSGAFRIERASTPPPAVRTARPRPERSYQPAGGEVVVTASKQDIPLLRYPGSVAIIDTATVMPAGRVGSLVDSARSVPILQSTQLGRGRNKLFIRGVADSSFNGSTQSPTSIYLDDVQLTYSGPDPALRLYDMQSVEVLEGPQGTLYGSGAIGGVIRLTSVPVDLSKTAVGAATGVTLTQDGAAGGDVVGMLNLPILDKRLGLRAVAYGVSSGGYIDDTRRGLRDVNRDRTVGGRLSVRLDSAAGWRVEASGATQWNDADDAQYSEAAVGPLARRSAIAQPFRSHLGFARLALSRRWSSGLHLLTATGIVGYHSTEDFDAGAFYGPAVPGPIVYRLRRAKELDSHETRLSRTLEGGSSWVVGVTLVSDRDALTRTIAGPTVERSIIGVTNVTQSASLFGETTFALGGGLALTAGARATAGRTDGSPSDTPLSSQFVRGRSTRRIDPTLAASWQVAPSVALFSRIQSGYRTGGLAVAPGIGRIADYRSDAITVGEVGVRRVRSGPLGVAATLGVSIARWRDIQADLINRRGQPITENIGDAHIRTLEGTFDWVPVADLRAQASFLFADTRVSGPVADLSTRANRRLPNTPPFAAHAALSYGWSASPLNPTVQLTADYIGRSVLGTGDLLDISQGDYAVLGLATAARLGSVDVSLTLDNLTNARASRFAFGNPFSFAMREQQTPLRPRNVRLGVSYGW